jgi:hypothetical protein
MSGKFRFFALYILLIGLFLYAGCSKDDDPVSSQDEHFEAIGVYLSSSGIKVGAILRGETSDTLYAPLGGLSDHIDVQFYDKNENIIDPPSDEDHSLAWAIDDTSMVEVWQHPGEEGGYEFHFRGKKAGTTFIEFFVYHGDHSDFRSGKFPVKVISQEGTHGEPVGLKLVYEETGEVLSTVNADGSVTGLISVSAGTETDHIEAVFFDENNVEFSPTTPEHSLGLTIGDESIAGYEGPDESEPWAFHITGKKAGTTTLTLTLYHEGEAEFTTSPVTIEVR